MFATVVPTSESLLVRGGLRSVAAGRVLVRGEHSRDVHDAQGPRPKASDRRGVNAIWGICTTSVRKKLASRTTLCADLAAGARPCLRQPLNRGRLRTNVSLARRRFRGIMDQVRHGGACV